MQPQQTRAQHFRLPHHFHKHRGHKQKQQLAQRGLPRFVDSSCFCCCCWLHFRVLNLVLTEPALCRDCVAGRRLPLVISPLDALMACDCAILFRCISMLAEIVGIVSSGIRLGFLFPFFAIFVLNFCNLVFCFDNSRMRLLSVRFSRLV